MQGPPGHTLPGLTGERGLPGEKVSLREGQGQYPRSLQLRNRITMIIFDKFSSNCCRSGK